MNKQEKEFYKSFSEHGTGDAKVCISPKEVLILLYITATDLNLQKPVYESAKYSEVANKGFYYITHAEVDSLPEISQEECFRIMEDIGVTNYRNISYLYMKNLCAHPPINSMEIFLESNPNEVTLSKKDSQIIISGLNGQYVIDRG